MCRNCVKSKRECLGYDPVFRAQPSTPSAIQPSPNPPPSLVVSPQYPLTFPDAPPGYVPAAPPPFSSSLQSESPSTSTDKVEQGNNVDPSSQSNPASDMASLQSAVDGSLQSQVSAPATGPPPAAESSGFKGISSAPIDWHWRFSLCSCHAAVIANVSLFVFSKTSSDIRPFCT